MESNDDQYKEAANNDTFVVANVNEAHVEKQSEASEAGPDDDANVVANMCA